MLAAGFDHTDASIMLAAAIAALPAVLAAIGIRRTHREVRTNHGIRQGARIEQLGEDMAYLRSVVVTKDDLQAHADHDELVATKLALSVAETKQQLLTAIGSRN